MSEPAKSDQPSIVLQNKEAILSYVQDIFPKNLKYTRQPNNEDSPANDFESFYRKTHEITRTTFKNISFKGNLHDIEFINCNFINCDFDGIWGFYLIYTKCTFYKCGFRYSRYNHIEFSWDELKFVKCQFRNVEWDEAGLANIEFDNCLLVNLKINGVYPNDNVIFYNCEIEGSHFEYINYSSDEKEIETDEEFYDLGFEKCTITDTMFNSVDLRNSIFYNTILYKCAFLECRLGSKTIEVDMKLEKACYASLDFQTILKSEPIGQSVLKQYFNITPGINLKETISTMTSEIQFYTVFISYSLKDQLFANRLNETLVKKGIRTFLWEKDAPAGKSLEEIMSTGIHKHQRVLFIASENSIKSKACQFELSEARRKQEALWETVFFPIHIDSYLFSVQKRDIRPVSLADEYWENIQELKRVHSIDFSRFNAEMINQDEFEDAVSKLIKDLKIEQQAT